MLKTKNDTLELLKLFTSYMVVFIHVAFYGKFGVAIDALARFAVPFFFLVSGYYSFQITTEKIKKRIRSIFALIIFSSVCCTIFEIICLLKYNKDGLAVFLSKYTDLHTYINFFLFNETISSGHLWYLFAVLYVYIIFYFVTKFHIKEKAIFIVSFFLLLLHVVLGEGLSMFGATLPIPYVRNFALMGIPFFALGMFAKKHENKFRNIPNYIILLMVVTGAFESIISRFLFGENELYIGSLFVLIAIVCVFIKGTDVKYPYFLTALDGCSTYIYIFHIIISTVIFIFYGVLGIDIHSSVILENLHPIIVCVTSTIFAYFFIKILKKFLKTSNLIEKTR